MTGPDLPPVITRAELFDRIVADTAHYLVERWPDELANVVFQVADMPSTAEQPTVMPRWLVEHQPPRVTIYRIPVERVTRLPEKDDLDRRIIVETSVLRAVAELIGKDPWDLAPDRYRHF